MVESCNAGCNAGCNCFDGSTVRTFGGAYERSQEGGLPIPMFKDMCVLGHISVMFVAAPRMLVQLQKHSSSSSGVRHLQTQTFPVFVDSKLNLSGPVAVSPKAQRSVRSWCRTKQANPTWTF